MEPGTRRRFRNLEALALRVDGVLTDGSFYLNQAGETWQKFNLRDLEGLAGVSQSGRQLLLLVDPSTRVIEARARSLGLRTLLLEGEPALDLVFRWLQQCDLMFHQAGYLARFMEDLPILDRVGLGIAVADAGEKLRAKADYVTERAGGEGAVREVCNLILQLTPPLGRPR